MSRLMLFYLFLSSVPASLLDLIPEDVELVSISIFFNIEFVSGPESHGLVLIRLRCRGDGATSTTNQRQRDPSEYKIQERRSKIKNKYWRLFKPKN